MNLDFLEGKDVNSEIPILFDYIEAILAKEFSLNKIDSEMFTMSVILNRSGLAQDLLFLNTCRAELKEIPNLNMADLETDLREACKNKYISTGYRKPTEIKLSPKFKAIIEEAYILSKNYADCLSDEETPLTLLAPHHILLAINKHDEEITTKVFKEYGIKFNLLEKIFINKIDPHTLDSDGNPIENDRTSELPVPFQGEIKIINSLRNNNPISTPSELKTVSKYCENITEYVLKQGENLKIVGRDKELKTMFNTLVRKNKNNVILCGETGVGRTSLVYKLAQSIIEGSVPKNLVGKEIWSLNVGKLISGTKFRGDFEQRAFDLTTELNSHGNIILFIADIHSTSGAGDSAGSGMDLSSALKPMLQDGAVQVIGTTTFSDFKKKLESDTSITRKFQKIYIDETTADEAITILKQIKVGYEEHHNMIVSDELIDLTVRLSKRYITDSVLPSSAIDVLDTCGASIQKIQPKGTISKKQQTINKIESQLDELRKQKKDLMDDGKFDEVDQVNTNIQKLMSKLKETKTKPEKINSSVKKELKESDITNTISLITGIPVSKVSGSEVKNLMNLEKNLNSKVIGQEEAVKKVSESVILGRMGLRREMGTISTILAIGSTGVGKTHLAKRLAYEVFGSEDKMLRIDMSEFKESHSISKILGSPNGYADSENGSHILNKIKHNPFIVLLWDEVEKSTPEVINLLLQIFDSGFIHDSRGNKIDCRFTINLLTSNVGVKKSISLGKSIGYNNSPNADTIKSNSLLEKELKNHFSPEFLNRIDEIVYFNKLDNSNLGKIIKIELNEINKVLKKSNHKCSIHYGDDLIEFIINKIENENDMGARPINRCIKKEILTPISKLLMDETNNDGYQFKINVSNKNELIFK
jgi:ATP-dependent Clp protease ATP-binding subunit ClpC